MISHLVNYPYVIQQSESEDDFFSKRRSPPTVLFTTTLTKPGCIPQDFHEEDTRGLFYRAFSRSLSDHSKVQLNANQYFHRNLPCKIFLNKALSMEVKWGIIRLISSGILGPTNKVFSVQEVIPELARSRAIFHFSLVPQNEATTIKARMAQMAQMARPGCYWPTLFPSPNTTPRPSPMLCTRYEVNLSSN